MQDLQILNSAFHVFETLRFAPDTWHQFSVLRPGAIKLHKLVALYSVSQATIIHLLLQLSFLLYTPLEHMATWIKSQAQDEKFWGSFTSAKHNDFLLNHSTKWCRGKLFSLYITTQQCLCTNGEINSKLLCYHFVAVALFHILWSKSNQRRFCELLSLWCILYLGVSLNQELSRERWGTFGIQVRNRHQCGQSSLCLSLQVTAFTTLYNRRYLSTDSVRFYHHQFTIPWDCDHCIALSRGVTGPYLTIMVIHQAELSIIESDATHVGSVMVCSCNPGPGTVVWILETTRSHKEGGQSNTSSHIEHPYIIYDVCTVA